jgi:hypothetical protein
MLCLALALLAWAKVDALPVLLEDGSVNAGIAFFTISYVVINVWTILQVPCLLSVLYYPL